MLSRLKVPSLAVALLTVTWSAHDVRAQEAEPQPSASAEPQAAPESTPAAAEAPAAPAVEQPAPAPAAPAAAAEPAKKPNVEEILVTGSRIRRMDLSTAAPVTVIGKDQMQASGKVSIGDFLQSLPEQSNAINTAVNNGGDGSTRINLRGLSSDRTLVLVNGRRMVPGGTGANSSVDLNSIPTAAIERVEVLKDGASAVYGSDAIGGVVNLITRKDWNGTELSAFAGTSGHGDGTLYDLNVTTGSSGERGSFIFSAGFYKQAKAMAGDRDFSKIARGYDMYEGSNTEYTYGSSSTPYGVVILPTKDANGDPIPATAGTQLYQDFVAAGDLMIAHDTTGTGWHAFNSSGVIEEGGDYYNYQPDNYLVTPQQRISLYATGDTKFGESARGYFEASYVNRQSDQLLAPEPLFASQEGLTISADNIYNPFGVDIVTGKGDVRRRLSEFGNRRFLQDIDTVRTVVGADGSLGSDFGFLSGWFWDVSLNYGRNLSTELNEGSLRLPPLQAALGPSGYDTDGNPVCLDDAGQTIDGCVPLNLFGGKGTITPDQIKGLTYTGAARGYNELVGVQANTSGELFTIAADRPVGLALGYEFRDMSGAYVPNPITVAGETTGNKGEITSGSYNVHEAYAELSLPIISGAPGFEDFEATLAARVFRYSNFGTDFTYKAGARWKIIPDLTVRGTYSTAFRAPSVADLYYGQSDDFPNVTDPCANSSSPQCVTDGAAMNGDLQKQHRSRVGGNPNLNPETANIITVGLVLEPTFVEGLSVTVDYYNISMEELIDTIGASVILSSCYVAETPKYCDLVERNSSGLIENIYDTVQNVGSLETDGIDVALRYALATEVGRFGFSFDGNWLNKYDKTLADGTVVHGKGTFDAASNGTYGVYPDFRFNVGLSYSLSGFAAGLNMRFIGSFTECGSPYEWPKDSGIIGGDFSGGGACYADNQFQRTVGAYELFDLYASYTLETSAGRTLFGVGVNNVLDRAPETVYNGFTASSDPSAYDYMGRYVFARIMQTF